MSRASGDGLTKHQRYTRSLKGQLRNERYEKAHPERRNRSRTGFIARDALSGGDQDGQGQQRQPSTGQSPRGRER